MAEQQRRSILGQSIQFQPDQSSSIFFQEISKAGQNLANDMQSKADVMYINSFLTEGRKGARKIYEKNQADPNQLKEELNSYKKGLLSSMPRSLGGRLEMEYNSISEGYLNKAITTKNKLLSNNQSLVLDENETQLVNDIAFAGQNLADSIHNKELSEDERSAVGLSALNSMDVSFKALRSNLQTVGADGNPLRTDTQINKSLKKSREALFSSFGKAWLKNQPDKLKAYAEWQDNKVIVEMPDGKINVRESMSFETRQKIDKEMINGIKNELYIEKQTIEKSEREREEIVEATKKEDFELAKTGDLTVEKVEASKSIYDFQEYKDFSIMAREANPITNGAVYGRLVQKAGNGEDISVELRNARFNDKSVSNPDYEHLLNVNKTAGAISDLPSPVRQGRDLLLGSLGGNSDILSILDSRVMAKAERQYNFEVENFISRERRQPNSLEAEDIAENLFNRFTILKTDQYIQTLEKPKAMNLSMKSTPVVNLTESNIVLTEKKINTEYTKKHSEEVKKALIDIESKQLRKEKVVEILMQDREYIEEIKRLNEFKKLVPVYEQKRARRNRK